MSKQPAVTAILVNWNGFSDTRECLISLSKVNYSNLKVIVVDNGSREDKSELLRSEFPEVTVIATGKNLGFTGGNNVGIRTALAECTDYILCLNNDTIVDPDFLNPLVQALEEDAVAGIATGSIFYFGQPDRLWSVGSWIDLAQFPPLGHNTASSSLSLNAANFGEVAAVDGCVMLMRRVMVEALGGFDDKFFAYTEDADLCLRARAAGWKCVVALDSHVWHKVSSSTGGENSPTAEHYSIRNFFRNVRLHGSKEERASFRRRAKMFRRTELGVYINQGRTASSSHKNPKRMQFALNSVVNAYVGEIGCYGPRENYRQLEQMLRFLVSAFAFLLRSPASAYSRIYWKINSFSPNLTRPLPLPLLCVSLWPF